MDVSCNRHFFLALLLNQQWSSPLRLEASHCSTFRFKCDVPSITVFCSESIECFPGIVSKFFLSFSLLFQWLQLLLVQSYISGSTFVASLYTNSCILTSFPLPFHNISACGYYYYYCCCCWGFLWLRLQRQLLRYVLWTRRLKTE